MYYGLAPYFSGSSEEELKKVSFHASSFDKCFYKINRNGQMDFLVRYWSDVFDFVVTRDLSSPFMGKASNNDILEHFIKAPQK